MKHHFLRNLTVVLGFAVVVCVGCSASKGIMKGTTPVTAIAPSHTINYPVLGDSGAPPKGKDILKNIPIPSRPRK
jgi:hypothetical protein